MDKKEKIKLNIIIPFYNEAKRLPQTLKKLDAYLSSLLEIIEVEIYLINDGSTDTTIELINNTQFEYINPHILGYEINRGKGYAVRCGMLNSRHADYYFMADADGSGEWNLIDEFFKIALNENLDCVIGSRALDNSEVTTFFRARFMGRLGNKFIKNILNLNFMDTQCGYKLFKNSCLFAFEKQQLDGFGFDFEILYLLDRKGLKIKEVPVKWENKIGSKVNYKHYITTLIELFKVKTNKYPL